MRVYIECVSSIADRARRWHGPRPSRGAVPHAPVPVCRAHPLGWRAAARCGAFSLPGCPPPRHGSPGAARAARVAHTVACRRGSVHAREGDRPARLLSIELVASSLHGSRSLHGSEWVDAGSGRAGECGGLAKARVFSSHRRAHGEEICSAVRWYARQSVTHCVSCVPCSGPQGDTPPPLVLSKPVGVGVRENSRELGRSAGKWTDISSVEVYIRQGFRFR
jgi:hypothetical protein